MASRKKIEKWIKKGSLVYLTSLGGGFFVGKLDSYDERDDTVNFRRDPDATARGWARASEVHRAKIKPGCTVRILTRDHEDGALPSFMEVGSEHVVVYADGADCLLNIGRGLPHRVWTPKTCVEFVSPAPNTTED